MSFFFNFFGNDLLPAGHVFVPSHARSNPTHSVLHPTGRKVLVLNISFPASLCSHLSLSPLVTGDRELLPGDFLTPAPHRLSMPASSSLPPPSAPAMADPSKIGDCCPNPTPGVHRSLGCSPATSTHQVRPPLPFPSPSCCATKISNPNVRYLLSTSDLRRICSGGQELGAAWICSRDHPTRGGRPTSRLQSKAPRW